MDQTTAYAAITKSERQADGTLLVTGVATDPSLDMDQQICDPAWLKSAMPAWMRAGGNVREQHSNIAAGVATEHRIEEGDKHVITARVVDPVSVKKVEFGVLKGFSIGIRNPRVTADKSAPGGRIVGGTICEISLVDLPCNETCKLTIAKTARPGLKVRADQYDAETGLVRVEEFHEVTKAVDADGPEMVTVPDAPVEKSTGTEAAPTAPAEDAPVAVEAGTDSGAPAEVVADAAGEGGGSDATVGAPGDIPVVEAAPDVPMVRPGEAVLSPADELARRAALAAVAPPVDAAPVVEPVVPVDAPGVSVEPAVKAVTPDALDLDAIAAKVADLLKAAGTVPAAAPVAAPVVRGDAAAVVAHLAARGRVVPDVVKGDGVTHDVETLRSVRNGLLSLIIAEATEALNGDDETHDMRMLLDSLDVFLSWWRCEAVNGEAPPPREVGAVDQTVEAAEAVASVLVGGPDDDLSGGVVAVGGVKTADAEAVKSTGCGCCDACTHDTAPADAPAVKTATPDAPASPETPALVVGSKADQPETVKAPDAEAADPVVLTKALESLRAENAELAARVEQLAKAAAPGGPVRTRPVAALRMSREGDVLRTKAAGYRKAAQSGLPVDVAAEYERLAAECEAQAAALTAEG